MMHYCDSLRICVLSEQYWRCIGVDSRPDGLTRRPCLGLANDVFVQNRFRRSDPFQSIVARGRQSKDTHRQRDHAKGRDD